MQKILSSFLIALLFIACGKDNLPVDTAPTVAEQTMMDVAYGSDPAQKMDVYLPAGRTTTATKILVLIHGGAWTTGDKVDFNEYIPTFKQRLADYALVNINYRLGVLPSTNPFPAQENDVKAALEFILGKSGTYLFNKEKLAVLGASAGGHLALLQAYKNNTPKVKAVADMFGPTDMAALYTASPSFTQLGLQALIGGTPVSAPAAYQASSPINFVSAQTPPTLILHGSADPLVPIAQSLSLKARLEAFNGTVKMVTYAGAGHGWTGAPLTDTYNQITDFLRLHNP